MNFQVAAAVAGAAFVLSFLSALIGGVPFLDILLRAVLWGALGFGASLGIEALLRALVPDLFQAPAEEAVPPDERVSGLSAGQNVNIALEEELPRSGFVEEVDDEPAPVLPRVLTPEEPASVAGAPAVPAREPDPVAPAPGEDEEMPEIGSFLDAFKPDAPGTPEGAAPSNPDYGEYAPGESDRRPSSAEVTIDGEAQDPALIARAVQTVLKRDAQGN